jgi:hypothetical protein
MTPALLANPFPKKISNCHAYFWVLSVFLLSQLLFLRPALSAQVTGTREVGIAASSIGTYRNSWAIIIGINRYLKAPRLNYAVNDANSIVAAVQQLGFPSDKILLLLDREATKQRIEQLLYGTLRRTTPEDRVFVFFAGHGLTLSLPRGGEEGFLLPVDGDPDDLPPTAIAMEEIRRIARRIPAKHILFAVDACYSGFSISRDVGTTAVDRLYLEAVTKEPALQIITAGRKGEQVLEEEGHGLFTRRLLSGLTGLADTDQNGIITAQELATWLESRVVRDSQDRQHPQYSRLDGEGQFVFLPPGRERQPATVILDEREKLKQELKRLAEEAERLKRDRLLLEEERKLHEDQRKIELAKLEADRTRLQAEAERLALEKAQSEKARQEAERKRLVEEAAKTELAKLDEDRDRLKAEEERIAKQKARSEEARLEAERKRQKEEVSKAGQPQVVAKLPSSALPARPPVVLPTVAELPKYKVGDSWTVRFNDGRTAPRIVRAIDKDQYVFEWGLDLWRYYDHNLILRKQITPEDGKDVFTSLVKHRTIDFPLAVNKTWEYRILLGTMTGRGARWGTVFYWRVFS